MDPYTAVEKLVEARRLVEEVMDLSVSRDLRGALDDTMASCARAQDMIEERGEL